MIKEITKDSSKELITEFYNQRGKHKQYWKCLKCGKEYNSDNAILERTQSSTCGFNISYHKCPYCKTRQEGYPKKTAEWIKSEFINVHNQNENTNKHTKRTA